MFCPMCGARTKVTEKRGIFRDRRCTSAACHLDFTTRENVMTLAEDRRLCARTRASNIEVPSRSPAAVVKGGSTSCSDLQAHSNSVEGESGAQKDPPYLQAEVGA